MSIKPFYLAAHDINLDVSEKNYGNLCHIFLLYDIPFKLIKNGIEIDITEKELYPYKNRLVE